MKYLLVLAVVLVAFYIWRSNRRADAREREHRAPPPAPAQPPAAPDAMVTCRHCGVHLPSQDAVKGTLGYYCGQDHRRLAEG